MSEDPVITEIESWLGRRLPDSYSMLLLSGFNTLLSPEIILYPRDTVIEMNERYKTRQYCPNFLVIGVSSEGRAILIPLTFGTCSVLLADNSGLDPRHFTTVSSQLSAWVEGGCKI